jgi:adenylate cyclase class 2
MLEVEMKFPIADIVKLQEKLRALNLQPPVNRREADFYFNAPDRDFAKTDEALRLRRVGDINLLTYKGPKLDPHTKTRAEIEVLLEAGSLAADRVTDLLKHLGYRSVACVRKERTIFHLQQGRFAMEISLDRVEGVGNFVELEIIAPEQSADEARREVMTWAAKLDLNGSERRSYLEMWLAKHGT